jgi:flagellar hook-associated protein 1 FlgK
VARGALPAGSYRIADYAAELVSVAAVQADAAGKAAGNDRSLLEDLDSRRASVSGVNVDEELARLVVYQQAYSVSARIVAITSELFDQLLGLAR